VSYARGASRTTGIGVFLLICCYKLRVISPAPPSPPAPCPPTRRAANPSLFHSSFLFSFPKSLPSTSSKSTTSALFRKTPGVGCARQSNQKAMPFHPRPLPLQFPVQTAMPTKPANSARYRQPGLGLYPHLLASSLSLLPSSLGASVSPGGKFPGVQVLSLLRYLITSLLPVRPATIGLLYEGLHRASNKASCARHAPVR
jgi:hypothetical protein